MKGDRDQKLSKIKKERERMTALRKEKRGR
jgi:hypothetical protein